MFRRKGGIEESYRPPNRPQDHRIRPLGRGEGLIRQRQARRIDRALHATVNQPPKPPFFPFPP